MSEGQQWDAERYELDGRFVSELGNEILEWLCARQGEHILDLGCGDGALTEKILDAGAIVTGIDPSADMVEAARRRGLYIKQMDALNLEENGVYDAVFSNAVLHWIEDWEALFLVVKRSLKEGGRFVVECGGHGNIAAIRTAIVAAADHFNVETKAGAETYLTPQDASDLLLDAGFKVERIELVGRRTELKTGMERWLRLFRCQFFNQFDDDAQKRQVMQHLLKWLAPQLRISRRDEQTGLDLDGQWVADYVRLRFIART